MIEAIVGRARALLDIYSPSPLSRVVVLGTMVLGAFLLARSANSGSGVGAIPFLLLVWANHRRFLDTVEGLLARNRWLVLAIPLGVFASKLLLVPPTAIDDLLRHIASAFWPGGYPDMYVHSKLPPVNLYPAFDWLVGNLGQAIGLAPAMWLVQAAAISSFIAVFVLAARRLLAGNPMADVLALGALLLVLQLMAGRLVLARPEIFMTTWALAAVLPRGRLGVLAWAAVGLLLGAGYWLAALYFPAAILLPLSLRKRILVFAAMSLLWAGGWWWFSEGMLIDAIRWPLEQVASRIPGLGVAENVSIVNVLLAPPMMALAFASLWAWRRAGADNRLLVLAGFYLLSNQARYGGIVAPLFALHALSAMRGTEIRWPGLTRSIAVAIGAVMMSVLAAGVPGYATLVRFGLPEGSVVLTTFNEATYSTIFANPGKVRVAPAFEVGALAPRLQKVVLDVNRGRLDCGELAGYGFTHLIERTLAGSPPACLRLEATQRGWRLWRVE